MNQLIWNSGRSVLGEKTITLTKKASVAGNTLWDLHKRWFSWMIATFAVYVFWKSATVFFWANQTNRNHFYCTNELLSATWLWLLFVFELSLLTARQVERILQVSSTLSRINKINSVHFSDFIFRSNQRHLLPQRNFIYIFQL